MPSLALALFPAISACPWLHAEEEVRGLSLLDPWASLMPIGEKRIETRSRNATYRGWVAIHASRAFPGHLRRLCETAPFAEVFAEAGLTPRRLARGAVIAVGRLADSFRFDADTASRIRAGTLPFPCARFEADFGDYTAGRWGYVFEHVRPLLTPIPAKGALGLWRLDATLRAALQVAPLGAPSRRAAGRAPGHTAHRRHAVMPLLEPSESCPALTDDAARAHLAIVAGSIAQLRAGDVERLLEAVTEAGDGAAFREWLLRQPLSERAAAIARAWVPSLAGPAAGATDQDVADDAPWVCPRCATRNSPPNAWCLCAHCGFDRCR